jgi:hypothetical protein
MVGSHGMCAPCRDRELTRYREDKMHGNDPSNDERLCETIQDVRDWYSDANNYGLPPGVLAIRGNHDHISVGGIEYRYNYDLADFVEVNNETE